MIKVGKSHLFLYWYVDNIILNPLSNAQKTGFSEKPVFCSCKRQPPNPPDIGVGLGEINNQFLITGFSINPHSKDLVWIYILKIPIAQFIS
ncbi:MAG: hypothetical protein DWQ58_12015 [Microcystis aeruginosa TA09]|nr:MAG: hypothetical protein DWQ58_12015 [Microcystis aeruginosa TA09]